ncbi:LOW QUALITY PROTEIN: maestro heat-like repeat-containing protein family member 7, partial [Corvus moneduloides]|uniref:LOW QUALITY PROTEIN: maestro heat-like repeat-containing protein family member 7 n=1 Tax=Corvus moneduloides TaxID=1196302 RepID=UPI001361FEEB
FARCSVDRTQEQGPARGRFRRTAQVPAAIPTRAGPAVAAQPSTALAAPHGTSLPSALLLQMICKFIRRIREEESSVTGTGVRAYPHIFKTKTSAALLDMLVEEGVSSPKQVPAVVRYIHQWLLSNEYPEYRLSRTLLDLTEAYPTDVVMTILRVAPSCDRAATAMWKTLMCSVRTSKTVMPLLLDVLESWPEHSTRTSDGDDTDVFALAATLVMWKILQVPCVPHVVTVYLPRLFVHLLFQVFFSTVEMPEKVENLWRACQEQHGLATDPNRFAVQTLKDLLCRLYYEDVVVAVEHKRGWDTLLSADTHHHAVGLLAREMSRASKLVRFRIVCHLFRLLSGEEPRRDLPALAFLVEVLSDPPFQRWLDWSRCGDSVLEIMSKNLRSECRERRRLALRGLVVLSKHPSMTKGMWSLTESLVELLQEDDSDVVGMTVAVLSYLFLYSGAPIPSPIALQLAEALLPLFDNDDSQVRLRSMFVFQEMMALLTAKGKKALKSHVRQSLLPLSFHCHDEDWHVANASRETLRCAASFLKRRDLERMLDVDQTWRFGEGLLAEDRSQAAEHLRLALPYLENPQEPLREAAVRFMEICRAEHEGAAQRAPAHVQSLARQTAYVLRALERAPRSIFQVSPLTFPGEPPCLWPSIAVLNKDAVVFGRAGGDAATPQCSEHATGQDGTERCRTAHSFLADPELFRGITPRSALEARLQDLVTRSFSRRLPFLRPLPSRTDRAFKAQLHDLLTRNLPRHLSCK